MTVPKLDTRRIRSSTPGQLSDYYRELLQHTSADAGTEQLLDAIERSSVSPKCFAAWLGVTKSPLVTKRGLQQNFSIIVRESAVRQLGRDIRSSRWKDVWDGVGGTSGLLELLSDLSVNEVRLACKLLGRCGGYESDSERRKRMTELFMGLQPHIFPDSQFKTTDRRPLGKFYRHLIPSCTEELVERIVHGDLKGRWKSVRDVYLMRFHPDVIRREQLQALSNKAGSTIDLKRFNGLVTQYPKASTGDNSSGFSPSMTFALKVLREVACNKDLSLEEDVFIDDLVRPLLRRAIRKGVPWPRIQEIVDLMMQYLNANPHAGKEMTTTVGDVHHLVAQCWAYMPDMFAKQLRKLCSDPIFDTSSHQELRDWEDFLDKIPHGKRYELLQLCFYASTGLDIDNVDSLKKVKGSPSDELFAKLTPQQALSLFTRLRTALGDKTHISIWESNSIYNMQAKYRGSGPDLDLFLVGLHSRNGKSEEARELAVQRVSNRKLAALKGSEPEQRTHYAQCALYYAVASGDIQLYQETLEWAQRFVRDPLVFKELYPNYMAPEVITRLTGIPDSFKDLNISGLRSRVEAINAVIEGMFDTACSAIREPSFTEGTWQGVLGIFQRIVRERINKTAKLKRVFEASDDDIYDALWKHTIEMLLSVEQKAHRPENKRLNAHSPRGPLDCVNGSHNDLKTKDPAIYRFFDNLAVARDEFWQKLRPGFHSAVVTLPKPFPRGLPLQTLTSPWVLDAQHCETLAPYLAQRVRATLFPDPTEALLPMPDDDETLTAVGSFIDNYKLALRMYIPESLSKKERTLRLKEPWDFAVGPLSRDRMNKDEARRFWARKGPTYLTEWPPCLYSDGSNAKWPLIPEVDDSSQRCEWNPFEAGRPNQPSRTLEPFTYLDATLTIREIRGSADYIWDKPEGRDPLKVPGNEVDINQIWHKMGEGGVLSALLYLEMNYGAAIGSLLEKPFPSADDPRYPALYLDGGFQGDPLNPFNAVRWLQGHLDDIPPAFLKLSAENMLAEMRAADRDEHSDASVQELALTLVVRCAESDRPMLARDFVLRTIFDRPSASSWHRILLKPTFLRRLSASDAHTVMESFADGVWRHVVSRDSVTGASNEEESTPKKHIKVTTVKLVAQLLQGTEFVNEEDAFVFLSTLLTWESHIDVRLNATKALLHMLDTPSSEIAEKVLLKLQTLIPEAGNLHELKLVNDIDWKLAEETLVLPTYPDIDDKSPTTELFVKHYLAASYTPERRRIFIDRILMPTLGSIQRQTARWISLFLKKHGIDSTEVSIPTIPPHAARLLTHNDVQYSPRNILQDLVSYATFKLAPPASIKTLNESLKAQTSDPEVQTWFQLYATGPEYILTFRNLDIISLLDKPTQLDATTGITPEVIHEQFLRAFKACVAADAPMYNKLADNLLANLLRGTYMTKPWWASHGKAIVSKMIAYVRSLRTSKWHRDPARSPSVLPDTAPWELLLLDPPFPSRLDTGNDMLFECELFALQIGAFVDDIVDGIYHTKLEQLKHFLALDPVSSTQDRSRERKIRHWTIMDEKPDFLHDVFMRNRVHVAVKLRTVMEGGMENESGRVREGEVTKMSDPLSRAHVLRVEVASYLLGLVEGEWEDVAPQEMKRDVRRMVGEWRACMDEGVRRVAWELQWVFETEE
ncbi:hypothetical protein IQ06DRAFT_293041 [Phaeosphaeriaceae sp. SRC1lsM3a]|nr:hypothetical protein IQ06DRAFT_293041 [Stagonospora sp. SRC1lsM3a]